MEDQHQTEVAPVKVASQEPPLNRDMVTFVGKNVDYYAIKWAKRNDKGKVVATWNGAAFFGGPAWLVYRKMYWQAVWYVAGVVLLRLLIGLIAPGSERWLSYSALGALGFAANMLYRSHAEKEVNGLRAQYATGFDLNTRLQQRGGTNAVGAWTAGIFLCVVASADLWLPFIEHE